MKRVILSVLLTGAASGFGATINWVDDAVGAWTNGANWAGGNVPASTDAPQIKIGTANLDVPVSFNLVQIGIYHNPPKVGILNVLSGGSLYTTNAVNVGARDGDSGILTIEGGDASINILRVGGDNAATLRTDATGTVNVGNGTVVTRNFSGSLIGCSGAGCVGEVNVNAGGVYETERLHIGNATGSMGMMNVNEGVLKIRRIWDNDTFIISSGTVHVANGSIEWAGGADNAGKLHSDAIQSMAEAGTLTWAGTTTNMLFDSYTYTTNDGSSVLYSYDWIDGALATTYVWSVIAGDPPVTSTLIDYQFGDSNGTHLTHLQQDGSLSVGFDFDATNQLQAAGNGMLLGQNTSTNNGTFTTISLGSDSVSKGVATLRWRLNAWDLTGLPGSTALKIILADTVAGEDVQTVFNLKGAADNSRIRMVDASGVGVQAVNFGLTNTNGADGIQFELVNDLDAQVVSMAWKYDGDAVWNTLTPGTAQGIDRFDQVKLQLSEGWTNNPAAFVELDYLTIDYEVIVTEPTPEELYDDWLVLYPGVGAETNAMDNPDLDTANNWREYALGGDPSDPADVGLDSAIATVEAGGTNYFDYIHVVRDDAAARGIVYYLELNDDLVLGDWTNAYYEVVGTNTDYAVDGFNQITNRVSTHDESQQFIRLMVGDDLD